jgi:hypothetical protein
MKPIIAAQHPDHGPHLGQRARRLGLNHPQRLDGRVRRRGGHRQAGLGADRDRRDVVGHGVVQVAGEPLALDQLGPIELAQPRACPEPEHRPERHRREQDDGAKRRVAGPSHPG